jgi:hypothetical protein
VNIIKWNHPENYELTDTKSEIADFWASENLGSE